MFLLLSCDVLHACKALFLAGVSFPPGHRNPYGWSVSIPTVDAGEILHQLKTMVYHGLSHYS